MAEPPPPYVTNERYKSVSRTLFQLGSALFAGAIVRAYTSGSFATESIGWLLGAVMLMWLGWIILGLLEPEK